MKVGISTACTAKYETEDALALTKSLGADCCEAYLQTFYEYRPEFAKKYATRTDGAEVLAVRVNPQNFEPQLSSSSRRIRGDGFYWLDQVLRSAQLFGAKNYTFIGDCGGDIAELFNFCARYGVRLCLENSSFGLYNSPSVFKELKERVDGLAGVFDLKQARLSGYPYPMYLKDMSGAIAYAHLSDFDENGALCLPGTGVFNFKELISRLKDEGFNGALIIDAPSLAEAEELKRSIEFLKETVYKL